MRFSTRATYGLRLCFLIAIAPEKVSLQTLSKQTGHSEKYLEQLIGMLRRGGIVTSKRGAGGGYSLSRPASEITLRDMLVALEDNIDITDCASGSCSDNYCPNKKIFSYLHREIDKLLTSFTLEDMVNEYKCY